MYRSSLIPMISSEALRAAIRAVAVLRELQASAGSLGAGSLARLLRSQNATEQLARELGRLRGLGDLLAPISTSGEIKAREERLSVLVSVLPAETSLLGVANGLFAESGLEEIDAEMRGQLIAADEMGMRALDEKTTRHLQAPTMPVSGQIQTLVSLLLDESTTWRMLDNSRLANRLVADHGFVDTYAAARKRARVLLKDRASNGKGRLKPGELRAFHRWNESVAVQLMFLGNRGTASAALDTLEQPITELSNQLVRWLGLSRLRQLPGLPELVMGDLAQALDSLQTEMMVSVQRSYGPGKSNFRALIESELA